MLTTSHVLSGTVLRVLLGTVFFVVWSGLSLGQNAPVESSDAVESLDSSAMSVPEALQGDFDTGDIAAATAWADRLNLADWLGPLAPLALSPFFGVACLSGLALYGPQWVTDNALLDSASPLCSVPVFVSFLVLTVLTSVPRLTKVSKPFAQAVDRLEAYAVIVILLVIKVMSSIGGDAESLASAEPIIVQAGVISLTSDCLLMIAMTINILVVNSVKFFFEFLVWLTPFPTIDAIFEICNKTLCAGLMTIYATSPTAATVLNLVILLAALIVFRWIGRRVKFHRTMLLDPVLAKCFPRYALPSNHGLIAFSRDAVGSVPSRSLLKLIRSDSGLRLVPGSAWSPLNWGVGRDGFQVSPTPQATLTRGWLTHTLAMTVCDANESEGADDHQANWMPIQLTISRRHDGHLQTLVEEFDLKLVEPSSSVPPSNRASTAKIEMA
ncbi:MAG: hypothetical protein AAF539_00375 [Planctomycetota bacterium]